MILYKACPLCDSEAIEKFLLAKDHTVSGELFAVWQCKNCNGAFTQNAPAEPDIAPYYKSEDYISHSDTKAGIVSKLYHFVRRITLRQKLALVKNASGRVTGTALDVGAGTGAFVDTLIKAGWQATGLEPDDAARTVAENRYNIKTLSATQLFHFQPASFDVITAWHVLEHVHSIHEYLSAFRKLIKPNGRIFIAVPNYYSYDASHYRESWAAWDVPRHLYHFSAKAMRTLTNKHGLNVIAIKPMWFDSYYVSMLSEKYKNGKGNLLSAFYRAGISNLKARANIEKCSSLIYIIEKAGLV